MLITGLERQDTQLAVPRRRTRRLMSTYQRTQPVNTVAAWRQRTELISPFSRLSSSPGRYAIFCRGPPHPTPVTSRLGSVDK